MVGSRQVRIFFITRLENSVYTIYFNLNFIKCFAVEEKLNELLDIDGGISKRKVSVWLNLSFSCFVLLIVK